MQWEKIKINGFWAIKIKTSKYEIWLLEIGGAIYKFKIKNQDQIFENIVLSYKNINEYKKYGLYLGANIGRFAGRIADGYLKIKNNTYYLEKNDNNVNFLHGGSNGMHKKKMKYKIFCKDDSIEIVFETTIYQLEDKIPGNIKVKIKYICKNDNVTIEYLGLSDEDSIFNPTNHTYFNLNGIDNEPIYNHFIVGDIKKVWINNDKLIPYKKIKYFSLKKGKYFKDIMNQKYSFIKKNKGYDNHFEISGSLIIRNVKFKKGIQISSSYKNVVIYTQNFPSKQKIHNKTSHIHNGIAIEFQNGPNEIKPNKILCNIYKNKQYKSSINWKVL